MKIATSEVMREIDRITIENMGIPGIVLMENAALKVLRHLETESKDNYVIICGTGNNGGDGFAVARHLSALNKNIEVFFIGSSEKLSKDASINYNALKNIGVNINKIRNLEDINDLRNSLLNSDITVDAIFGTGLKRELEDLHKSVISIVNENSKNIVAIDIPSGMDSNTGKVWGNCIKARKTISFQLYKRGFLGYDTYNYTGDIIIEAIGIPEAVIDKLHQNEFMIEKSMIKKHIPLRDRYAYKGDYGRTLIIAGSKGFSGAAYIATQAAVRSGAGLVTLACSKDTQEILSSKLSEAMTVSYEDLDFLKSQIEKSDVIAFGPGMGNNEKTLEVLKLVLEKAKGPIVLDADGINVLQNNLNLIKNIKNKLIFTPHLGEMARLTGLSIDYIRENRLQVAKDFAMEHGVIVLLKGYHTIITDGTYTYINPTGNSAMASGGMGDCLTGIITSFISQSNKPIQATYCAAFIHGYIGEELSKKMFCVNASHIIEEIPYALKEIQTF